MERTKFFPDSRDPTLVVRGWVKCSKDGEPMDLFAPAKASRAATIKLSPIGRAGGGAGPIFRRRPRCSQDQRLRPYISIRAAFAYIVGLPPLNWSKPKLRELGVTGHSPHATLCDVGRTIGKRPNFPFEVDAGAACGFSKEDRRDLGHWAATASSASAAAEEDSEDEPEPPPAHFVPARRGRGRAGHVSRGSSSARGDMDLVYSRGDRAARASGRADPRHRGIVQRLLRRAGLGEDPSSVCGASSRLGLPDLVPMGPLEGQHSRPAFSQRVWLVARAGQRGGRSGASPFRAMGHAVCALEARIGAEGVSSDARRQRGSIAVGNLVARAREASDPSTWEVKVDRSSPLGNPFPMSPGQDRSVVCKAFESLVRKGLSVEEVAREFSPPLVFDASFAS
eukprot:scaffold1321_cov97-Isochrysis_galbana.AAC.1